MKFSLKAFCIVISILAAVSQAQTPQITALSRPMVRAIFQRNDQNIAFVPIEGTYSGTATRIEARTLVIDGFSGTPVEWQVVDESPSGGTFSSFLPVPAGGWYRTEIRAFNDQTQSNVFIKDGFSVGEVFIVAGQSNSANCGSPAYTPTHSTASVWTGTGWRHAYDPLPIASCSGGSPWSRLADLLIDEIDLPVGFLSVGVGGTMIEQWVPSANELYPRIQDAIAAVHPNGMRAILWHQGESDAVRPPTTGPQEYAEGLRQVIDQSRSDAGFPVPWGIAMVSWMPPESYGQIEEWRQGVRNGQQLVIEGDPLCFLGPDTDIWPGSTYRHDNIHFNATGLMLHAQGWMPTIRQIMAPWDLNLDNNINLTDMSDFASLWLNDKEWPENNDPAVAFWQFNEADGLSAADSSGNAHNATLINGPTWTTGISDAALSFDGLDDYVAADTFQGISDSSARTVSAWIKTSVSGTMQGIVSWGQPGQNGKYWALLLDSNGKLGCSAWSSDIFTIKSVNDGNWHHVAASWPGGASSGIASVKLYIDGIPAGIESVSDSAGSISTPLTGHLYIGGLVAINSFYFNGIIDDVRVYDSAFNANDIKTTSTPIWNSDIIGGPFTITGPTDVIEADTFQGISGSDTRSITAWINTGDTNRMQAIVGWGTPGETGKYWGILVDTEGRLGCSIWNSDIYSTTYVNDGRWHHIAISFPGGDDTPLSSTDMYIDGIKVGTSIGQNDTDIVSTTLAGPIHIGGFPEIGDSFYFGGMINDLRIYDSTISPATISPICDFDHNGTVNLSDLSTLAAHWLE